MDDGLARDKVLKVVATTPAKLTPLALTKTISRKYGFDRKQISSLIKKLVAMGDLAYTYEHGCTFLAVSFNKPIRISEHVVLKPPERHYRPQTGDVVVTIKPGASFGAGRHPTTRLAVKGVEYVLKNHKRISSESQSHVLDVGTGTGILVLTAVLFGIKQGLAIDIDPIAQVEARENVKLNGLEDCIEIGDIPLESIRRQFDIVTANLRFPSLTRWSKRLADLMSPGGFLVLSGVRMSEREELLDIYLSQNCYCRWQAEELDWVGVVLHQSA